MDCLGTNTNEVKENIKQGIQSILQYNGGTLKPDGTVELGNTQIDDIAEYIKDAFGTTEGYIERASWLVERGGKIHYQFPKEIKNIVEKSFENKRYKEQRRIEKATELALERDIIESMTEEELSVEDDPNNLLFAPSLIKYSNEEIEQIINAHTETSGTAPTDFKMWLSQRTALLKNLEDDYQHFRRTEVKGTDFYREKTREYQKVILNLKKSIADLSSTELSLEDVYADVIKELEYLSNVIDTVEIVELDTQGLKRRLDILSKLFLNKTFNGENINKPTAESNVFFVLKDEFKDVRDKLNDVLDKYDEKSFNQVASLMSDNAFIQEMKRQNKLEVTNPETGELYTGEEAVEFFVKLIEEVQTGGTNWLKRVSLGANWQGVALSS